MSLYDIPINRLDGTPSSLAEFQGKAVLAVNVASKCGLTPQYEQLEQLQKDYGDKGFSVVGFPSNQFLGRAGLLEFCSTTYGVSFPLMEKIEVNGENRHPIYEELTAVADTDGETGDVQWNFEKFLISPAGEVVGRFRPTVLPDAPEVIEAIEANLPA